MFSSLKNGFMKVFDKITQKGTISTYDLDLALREIRITMLEADVALSVTKNFIDNIKSRAIGKNIVNSVTPGQMIIKIVHDELKTILGDNCQDIRLRRHGLSTIMLVGLQGVGKTTNTIKLALYLRKKYKRKVLVASVDVYRPAAQKQLETLGKQVSLESLSIMKNQSPLDIATRALEYAHKRMFDLIILDTPGILHSDNQLTKEIINIKSIIQPVETLLVADSMTGQDAVNSARYFNDRINLSGIILTRIDGDSRGGAALSIKYITRCPIKFISNGEKVPDFDRFYPDRIASRVLDMGDIVTLVEKAIDTVNEKEAKNMAQKMEEGAFDMEDLRKQLRNIKKIGGISSVISMLPGIKGVKKVLRAHQMDKSFIVKQEAIIDSMTKKEKMFPKIMSASRKIRVSVGSGVNVQDINKLIKQFLQMQKMLKKVKRLDNTSLKKINNIFLSNNTNNRIL